MDGTRRSGGLTGPMLLAARPCGPVRHDPDCDAAAVLGIFRARTGGYVCEAGEAADEGLVLVISESAISTGVCVVVSHRLAAGPRSGEPGSAAVISADGSCAVTMIRPTACGAGRRMPLRVQYVDAVRRGQIVFGIGDIEGDGFSEEIVFDFGSDGGVATTHAWGAPGDPYAARVRRDWRPSGRVRRRPE